MRAGTRFDEEDYENPDSDGVLIDEISGYRARRAAPTCPPDTYAWILALTTTARTAGVPVPLDPHRRARAGRRRRRPGRASRTCSRRLIWSRIGAERDAEIIVDAAGFAAAEGGICTTLRDLARFGLMHLDDGAAAGASSRRRGSRGCATRDDELVAAFDRDLPRPRPRTPSTTTSGGSWTPTPASTAATASTASSC